MNLATEYLIRTKTFRKLITYPITVAVEGPDEKFWIVLNEENNKIKVLQWDLLKFPFVSEFDYWEMSQPHSFVIEKEQLFDKNVVIPINCRPLEYCGIPIASEYNDYAHPMDKETYEMPFYNIGKCCTNTNMKIGWLWNNFIKNTYRNDFYQVIKNPNDYYSYYQRGLDHLRYTNIYNYWKTFYNTLFINTKNIHGELIFSNL